MKTIHINNINQLPIESLVEIFLLAQTPCREDRYPHLHLSLVCRHWRKVINDHGVFWTLILFSPWEGGERFIWESVTRSRSQKLSVFSSFHHNVYINDDNHPRLERAEMKEIIKTFDDLLRTEGHRIKFLYLVDARPEKLQRVVLGKALPVLKTVIFSHEINPFTKGSDSFAIIKAAKSLENLGINLRRTSIDMSSLSELKPSFERFINLKLGFISWEVKKQIFISILPSCYKLESLTVSTAPHSLGDIHLPSVITLTKLILLNVDCYALAHKLRAPALKRLSLPELQRIKPDQHDYLIFDEYDLSPVTQLVIRGVNILAPQNSSVVMTGLAGSKFCHEDPWTPFEMARYTNCSQIDLRRDNIDASFVSPTQFYVKLPTYNTPNNGGAPPDLQPSPTLSKILFKLHNLERLYIVPFNFAQGHVPRYSKSILESLKTFLKIIFDNLISSRIKWLCIGEIGRDVDILRLIFDLVKNCFALSNLDMMELGTPHVSLWHHGVVSLRRFAEELVNCLQFRQNAGYRALPRLEVHLGAPLPKKCIEEAAVLGTQVIECEESSRDIRIV